MDVETRSWGGVNIGYPRDYVLDNGVTMYKHEKIARDDHIRVLKANGMTGRTIKVFFPEYSESIIRRAAPTNMSYELYVSNRTLSLTRVQVERIYQCIILGWPLREIANNVCSYPHALDEFGSLVEILYRIHLRGVTLQVFSAFLKYLRDGRSVRHAVTMLDMPVELSYKFNEMVVNGRKIRVPRLQRREYRVDEGAGTDVPQDPSDE